MPKILIADDSDFQIGMLTTALEEKGFEVVAARDTLQAGMAVRKAAPDAIVLDINMPGGSGIEVIKRLRNSGKTKEIPIIVVSGNGDPATREAALKLGAIDFLSKPVDLDKLAKVLSGCVPANR